jgi:hypothetical protein
MEKFNDEYILCWESSEQLNLHIESIPKFREEHLNILFPSKEVCEKCNFSCKEINKEKDKNVEV